MPVTFDDVDAFVKSLPGVTLGTSWGNKTWLVGDKAFAWRRPFSKADLKRFGDETPPRYPIVAVRVDDLVEKEAVLGGGNPGFFTIPHFDGYAAVLIELRAVGKRALKEAIIDGWLACAPPALAEQLPRPARGPSPQRR